MLSTQKLIKILFVAAGTFGLHRILWNIADARFPAFIGQPYIFRLPIELVIPFFPFLQAFVFVLLAVIVRQRSRSNNQIIFVGILMGTGIFLLVHTLEILFFLLTIFGVFPLGR